MTFRRLWIGVVMSGLVLGFAGMVARGAGWDFGAAVAGPAVLDGPHVTISSTPEVTFGGLSGLLIEGDRVLASSDKGTLFQATITRGANGWLTPPTDARAIIVPTTSGQPVDEFKGDLEGLARLPDGRLVLAFESYSRIETLQDLDGVPRPTHAWDFFEGQFGNQAFEGVATLPDGRVLAIREGFPNDATAIAHLWDGDVWSDGIQMPLSDGFVIVGADIGPDQCLYLLDRRYTLTGGFAHRLRRVARLDGIGEMLYKSAPADLGNAEGLSVTEMPDGSVIATLITDNNFVPFTPTRLIEYRLTASQSCDGGF
jgi:hypothetical protein